MAQTKLIQRGGNVYTVRTNPPRDINGKPIPTKKQLKAREQASKRMKQAWEILRKRKSTIPKVGTKALGKAMKSLLTYNVNEDGKRHSRLKKERAKVCRSKDGKRIAKC